MNGKCKIKIYATTYGSTDDVCLLRPDVVLSCSLPLAPLFRLPAFNAETGLYLHHGHEFRCLQVQAAVHSLAR